MIPLTQCENLGERVEHDFGDRKWGYRCKAGRGLNGVVRGAVECCQCKEDPKSDFKPKVTLASGSSASIPSPERTLINILPKCAFLGEVLPGEPCGSQLRRCNYDNTICTRIIPCGSAARCCQTCEYHTLGVDDGPKAASKTKAWFEWISTKQLAHDTANLLLPKLPSEISGVCGIARSGLIPASILAAHLQVPLLTIDQFKGGPMALPFGSRGKLLGFSSNPKAPLVIVDDTVYGGTAIRRLRDRLKRWNVIYAAVYVRPEVSNVVNVFGRHLPSPHLLEWNLFNTGVLSGHAVNPAMRGGVASDFDGVLCQDPTVPDADSGPGLARYEHWLRNAKPLLLPRRNSIPMLVTFRLERWRKATEDWCKKWGVRFDKLIMHPAAKASDRNANFDVAGYKGKAFRESPCAVFIESDRESARIIHSASHKPVICNTTGEVFQ